MDLRESVEFSARNIAIALMVASTTLGRLDYAVFLVAYFVVQMTVTALVLTVLSRLTPEPGGRRVRRARTRV